MIDNYLVDDLRDELLRMRQLHPVIAITYIRAINGICADCGYSEIRTELKHEIGLAWGRLNREKLLDVWFAMVAFSGLHLSYYAEYLSEMEALLHSLNGPKHMFERLDFLTRKDVEPKEQGGKA